MNWTLILAIVAAALAAGLILALCALASERRKTTPERIEDLARASGLAIVR